MRSHAKAASARSTEGNGGSRAPVRRAFATGPASGDAKGRGARSARHFASASAVFAFAICVLAFTAGPASAAPPVVTIDSSPTTGYTTAQVSGTVDPAGNETNYFYQYSTDEVNWVDTSAAGSVPFDAAPTAVPQEITGLQSGTKYFFRLAAYNLIGDPVVYTPGPYPFATTLSVDPPAVTVDPASTVTGTTAHFSGTVTPAKADPVFDSTCKFEYITDAAFKGKDEVKQLVIKASGGTFKLGYEGEETAPIPYNASAAQLDSALEGLAKVGSGGVVVSGGPGNPSGAPPYVITFPNRNAGQLTVDGGALTGPGSAKVKTTVAGIFGDDEVQVLTVQAIAGTFTLTFEGQTTPALAFDAPAATVQAALEGLPKIGAGNVTVFGSGGPGDSVGSSPYTITFVGALAETNVPALAPSAANLVGTTGTAVSEPSKENPITHQSEPTTIEGHAEGFEGAQTVDCNVNPVNAGPTEPPPSTPVNADAIGLTPHATYHLRLRGEDPGGAAFAVAPNFTTEVVSPTIASTSVVGISEQEATLQAEINPGGAATTYHFEYLSQAEFDVNGFSGAVSTPESASIGSDNSLHTATAPLSGLLPGTAYRYRVVAKNEKSPSGVAGPARAFLTDGTPVDESETCSNAAVREQQKSTFLPECRAYEIVNNPNDELGDVNRVSHISEDGNMVATTTTTPGAEVTSNSIYSQSLGRRTATGWSALDANLQALDGNPYLQQTSHLMFSSDFQKLLIWSYLKADPDDVNTGQDVYRVPVGTGVGEWLTREMPFAIQSVIGASADLSRVVFEIHAVEVSNNPEDKNFFLHTLWTTTDGNDSELVTVLPNGEQVGGYGVGQMSRQTQDFLTFYGGNDIRVPHGGLHGVSDSGRLIYFQGVDKFLSSIGLYVRDVVAKKTTAVSASQRSGEVGTISNSAQFLFATHDGETVYFSDPHQLTDAATPGGGIYRFKVASKELVQITPPTGGPDFTLQVAATSDDGSHMYFKTSAALTPGAVEGGGNTYVWSGGTTRLVTTVPASLMRVSVDGRFLLMQTGASINGSTNEGHNAVFEYDDQTGDIVCASCRPDGSPSQGDAALEARAPGFPTGYTPTRSIATDGKVFFTTRDRIDKGDETSALDVYMYDAGKVSLLSAGDSERDTYYGDSTDDGRNVFIITRSALLPQDVDADELDVYDVRVDGGFLQKPPPSAPCEGEACRDAGSSALPAAAPVTPNFVGAGNKQSGRNQGKKHHKKHHKKHKKSTNKKRDAKRGGRAAR